VTGPAPARADLAAAASITVVRGEPGPPPAPPAPLPDPADAELLVVQLLAVLPARVVTDLPADIEGQLPVLQVTETPGGARLNPAHDTAVIDYDAYAATRAAAKGLAAAARLLLLDAAGFFTAAPRMWVERVVEVRRPVLLAYDDASDIRRFGGAVRLYIRFTAPR
jgi:hypothetical protein